MYVCMHVRMYLLAARARPTCNNLELGSYVPLCAIKNGSFQRQRQLICASSTGKGRPPASPTDIQQQNFQNFRTTWVIVLLLCVFGVDMETCHILRLNFMTFILTMLLSKDTPPPPHKHDSLHIYAQLPCTMHHVIYTAWASTQHTLTQARPTMPSSHQLS